MNLDRGGRSAQDLAALVSLPLLPQRRFAYPEERVLSPPPGPWRDILHVAKIRVEG